ncbi:LacI family transcriptional regulator [Galliscardovia ingluviei]|uniref:LacI family transcriptional regulator n=1 Tax=Galliscardovia ingluviei TaxID=1769422 RepID=A0A8J3AED4_9BIFI|nr:LacI family DNA-binding transcriptional regulator [Galliscardovia ingluviei]GGI12778.1 LacI family transcriptional regulator [Galliscardovia ingluviei]
MKPTIADVAQLAGVSQATVSRALRGVDSVTPTTRQKVLQAAEQLHFTLSKHASSLASGKNMRVMLLTSGKLNQWFNANVLQGIYDVLNPAGYDIAPSYIITQQDAIDFFRHLPNVGNVDAMIIASFQVDNQMRAYLQQTDIPVIGVDIPAQSYGNASIGIDNVDGMRKAVQLLRSLGHSTIGFVTDYMPADMVYSTVERAHIFEQVAQEYGLDQRHAPIISLSEYDHFTSNEQIANELVSRILGLEQRPTALCVQTDASAIAVIKALRNQGIRVPEDMSVVGFDDADIADIADLTTLRQDPYAMGVIAAKKTLDLLHGVELAHPHELLPARIILRSTTQLAKGLA